VPQLSLYSPVGDIAVYAETSGSAWSTRQANGPHTISVCHRVVAARRVGGYAGGDGSTTKCWLLGFEDSNRTL